MEIKVNTRKYISLGKELIRLKDIKKPTDAICIITNNKDIYFRLREVKEIIIDGNNLIIKTYGSQSWFNLDNVVSIKYKLVGLC